MSLTQPLPAGFGTEDARRHAESVTRAAGTSFFPAMARLPEPKRSAMFAVYAFCREVDDIADGEDGEAEKRDALQLWRREIADLCAGRPASMPTGAALVEPIATFALREADFLAVIEGMERDAAPAVRVHDRADLAAYCDHVACAVGRLSNRVFGAPIEHSDAIAWSLGQALQLTNILRDIAEDAERDRLYLPLADLKAVGIEPRAAREVIDDERLKPVCRDLAHEAERHFDEADRLLALCDANVMKPALMMRAAYGALLERVMERDWERMGERVSLGTLAKLKIALRFGFS
ncbi:MAG: presqualene diphosphate synthase HpnD [Rhodospirillales bacterium]